jgi:hypothetical protein
MGFARGEDGTRKYDVQPRICVDLAVPLTSSHLIEVRISLVYFTAQNFLVDRTGATENILCKPIILLNLNGSQTASVV